MNLHLDPKLVADIASDAEGTILDVCLAALAAERDAWVCAADVDRLAVAELVVEFSATDAARVMNLLPWTGTAADLLAASERLAARYEERDAWARNRTRGRAVAR